MSRIGKLPIAVPAGVTVTVSEDNLVTVKGPKGALSQKINPDIKVSVDARALIRAFKRYEGITPGQYAEGLQH